MRSLSRRRPRYLSTIPEVDDDTGPDPDPRDPAVAMLRQREGDMATNNDIADYVIYYVQSAGTITNPLKMSLYDAAIRRFRHRLPPELIRVLVDATIMKDRMDREKAERFRKAEVVRLKTEKAKAANL